jgi:hypothetical protein
MPEVLMGFDFADELRDIQTSRQTQEPSPDDFIEGQYYTEEKI